MNDDAPQLDWSTTHWGASEPLLPGLDPVFMRLLLENISTRVVVFDRDRCYLYANREALRFIGLPADRVIGKHVAQVLDSDLVSRLLPVLERLFAGEALHMRGWVDFGRQGRRYREHAFVPYSPGGGPVKAVVVCGLDHTDQRLGEQQLARQGAALRASEALKSAIVDNALAAIISTDESGRVVEFNPSAQAMLRLARDEVLGQPIGQAMRGLPWSGAGGQALPLGRRFETRVARADGTEFPAEMVLWRTNADDTTFYTVSIVDVSERHRAAQQIERQREALRQSEKLTTMGSLLAGVSHELNNPLSVVMGRARLLAEKCEGDPGLLQDALRIRDAAERCGRIVRTFLNMARSKPPRRSPVSLNDAVRSAADMLGYSLRSHDVGLELQLDAALPEISADGDQLCQVVLNLLVNAQQALALAEGPRRVNAVTGADPVAARVWLRIVDNGPGVPAHLRARIFEAFFTTKADGMGTGMGLAVSRALVREHGGDLLLETDPSGGGAAFRLWLPLVGVACDDDAPVAAPDAEPASAARVLVVDDEPEISAVIREMLESAGYEVAATDSGAVALELLREARFDAVVSDLRMPDMDGAALWREVCVRHPALADRLLFVTGDILSPAARRLLETTGCEVLEKPFAKPELVARIGALLARAAARNI